jgi:hypothetical protein
MVNIEIFITYYGDGTCSVREVYINNIRKAKYDEEKGKIDLSVLDGYDGCSAKLICTHINDVAKNNTKLVKIKTVENQPDGLHVLHYDIL